MTDLQNSPKTLNKHKSPNSTSVLFRSVGFQQVSLAISQKKLGKRQSWKRLNTLSIISRGFFWCVWLCDNSQNVTCFVWCIMRSHSKCACMIVWRPCIHLNKAVGERLDITCALTAQKSSCVLGCIQSGMGSIFILQGRWPWNNSLLSAESNNQFILICKWHGSLSSLCR